MNGYCIYCHTNKLNGKKYIGQTHDYQKRCQPANYKGCTKFYYAIQKYGWDNFLHEILEQNLSLEEANKKEEYYIKFFNTIENGYNLKSGGLNNIFSNESKKKMSKSCSSKRKIICIETNIEYPSALEIERLFGYANTNIIACCKGKLHTAYGFHWKYSEDDYILPIDKRKKSVRCIELNIIYDSATEAAKQLNLHRSSISRCCEGKLNSTGGYHWEFVKNNVT